MPTITVHGQEFEVVVCPECPGAGKLLPGDLDAHLAKHELMKRLGSKEGGSVKLCKCGAEFIGNDNERLCKKCHRKATSAGRRRNFVPKKKKPKESKWDIQEKHSRAGSVRETDANVKQSRRDSVWGIR